MEREQSDLYGLPLEEFVPARTELEKRLRKDGDRERAAAVKRLPKPTAAAWAVNQASRCRPKERRALLDAAAELRDVQERLLSGDASARELESATAKQREAIDGLVEAAAGLLSKEGRSMTDATLGRVRETFAAVATDTELAELVEAGTLDRERQATSLGFPGTQTASSKGKSSTADGNGKAPARLRKEDEKARKAREKELAAARERAKAAKREEREAKKRVEAAERAARRAADELAKRERQLDEARAAADSARGDLEDAAAAHDAATSARDEAEAELDRLT